MVIKFDIVGYQAFDEFISNFNSNQKLVHIYFIGSKFPNGESWCDDCNKATSIIHELEELCDPESFLIIVQVGDHLTWNDMDNPFRKDPRTQLIVLPTIIRWKLKKKLEGDVCLDSEALKMLLTGQE
ncbi:thioredoxin domain-containing protein 17-like [Aethina tumida]|uniref:thioredoxin domain-containing protein 17-like n=1 Tax=Aethina tumida TaxID=116153 RepID=UPI00096AF7A3|nr:thioredoxin domain-containing protein 17-like [Aethina tumida]